MKTLQWICLIVMTASIVSCKRNAQNKNEPKSEVHTETIKIIAQQRPFSDPEEFDMTVKNSSVKLEYAKADQIEMDSTDLVLGLPLGETIVAIPIKYLSAYEIANLSVADQEMTVTWCPLVGTARAFDSRSVGNNPGFDFGMALRNNNLIMVDRSTRTVWNQLSGKAIKGELEGERLDSRPSIQSTWGFWKRNYPETKLLIVKDTTGTIFPQFLDENPHYTNWQPGDDRPTIEDFHQPEVLGLGIDFGTSAVYFPFKTLFKLESPITYEIAEQQISIHFDASGLTAWVEDTKGNMLPSVIAYNWAWKKFFPDTEVFEE